MIVDCAVYEKGKRRSGTLELEAAYEACRHGETFVWIGLHEPSEAEFDSVAREFELHELAVEDAITAHQRPKLELYGDSLFVVLKTAAFNEGDDGVAFGEILLFVGESFLISVRHGDWPLHDVRLRMEGRPPGPAPVRSGRGTLCHRRSCRRRLRRRARESRRRDHER